MFIDSRKLKEFAKEAFNKADLLFYNDTCYISNSLLNLVSKFETEFCNKQFGSRFILDSLSTEISINLIRELKTNMPNFPGLSKYNSKKRDQYTIDFLWEKIVLSFPLIRCNIANLALLL